MMKFLKKQRGLSLFETMLAVMLVGGVIAILMNVESGSKSSDNNTILAQDISLLLNKSLEKATADQNETISFNISTDEEIKNMASYLDVSTNFISSLMGRGLKKYTLTTSSGAKDSGEMEGISYRENKTACDYVQAIIHNASSYSWLYDQEMSEEFTGQGSIDFGSSTPTDLDITPIEPGDTVRIEYHSGGDKIKKYLYFRSTAGNHIVGYYIKKDKGKTGDNGVKVNSNIQRGQNFTRHGDKDKDADCGKDSVDSEYAGRVELIIFDPVIKNITVDAELASIKQTKIVSSKTYGLIDSSNSDVSADKPIDMLVNNKNISYIFKQPCADGTLDQQDGNGVLMETPSGCAYSDTDDSVVDSYGNPVHV